MILALQNLSMSAISSIANSVRPLPGGDGAWSTAFNQLVS